MSGAVAPLFTVGLPFRADGRELRLAVASVLAQSDGDFELILVDDGPAPAACAWAAGLGDPRIRIIADGVNRGLAPRLNQIAALARGRFVVRMDADDVCAPRRLERLRPLLLAHADAGPVGSAAWAIDAADRVVGRKPAGGPQRSGWAARHSFIHPTVAAARTWWLAHPYDGSDAVRRAEDAELWCRASRDSRFAWIDEPLLYYREVGVFSLAAYRATSRGLRAVIARHGPPPPRAWLLGLGLHLRDAVHAAAAATGAADVLVRRRSRPPAPDERAAAQAAIDALAQSLPAAQR